MTRLTIDEVVEFGERARDEQDEDALERLCEIAVESTDAAKRATAALFLGACTWDERQIEPLTMLLADPSIVSLASNPGFTDAMNSMDIYSGRVVGAGKAVATLMTQNVGDLGAQVKRVAEVALRQHRNPPEGDARVLTELILTGDAPVSTDDEADRILWMSNAAELLRQLDTDLDPALVRRVAVLVADEPAKHHGLSILLDELQEHWTAEAIAQPIDHPRMKSRMMVARRLSRLAKRGDPMTRPYLERLAEDDKWDVRSSAKKGLKRLAKKGL